MLDQTGNTTGMRFNVNKFQAALCIAASSAVSIGLMYWAASTLF
ncbi:hypothetical protein [Noviherbaspirillum galbum]|nr:hypothetical protein [Noviherbaspirillum galbum]